MNSKKMAVILAGSGYLDGSEINEAVLALLALDQRKICYEIFAPNINLHHVINHFTQEEEVSKRNVLHEAARIARSKIKDIKELQVENFMAIVLPGGFGVAKNLSSLVFKGSQCEILPVLENILKEFHQQKKPIGAICIAPAIVAKALQEYKVKITLGHDIETAQEMKKIHCICEEKNSQEICIDEKNLVFSTPAYMNEAHRGEIFQGISLLIEEISKRI